MKNEEKQEYYVGLDIGTNSVGHAVTDKQYNLCKFKGDPMWGVTLFDEAELAVNRRNARSARRRLDRRQQRVQLIMDLFAVEIGKMDDDFFRRIKESYKRSENDGKNKEKVRIFNTYEAQKEYVKKYPTIHHLITELMKNKESHDVRLVYLACAWLVAHRGHFLSEVDKNNVEAVTDFKQVYDNFVSYIEHDDYYLPWSKDIDINSIANVLKMKQGISAKVKALSEVLFEGGKAPNKIDETHEYRYDLVIKLICGGKSVSLKDLFGKEEYEDLEEKNVSLDMDDEKLAVIMQSIGDDFGLIIVLKAIYDWSVLVDALRGEHSISEAKVAVYEQHQRDLKYLKSFIKKYAPEKYHDVFRSLNTQNNYVAYIGKSKNNGENSKVKKAKNKEEFCKYIQSIVKKITPESNDMKEYEDMLTRLEVKSFLPKQVDSDNRVIPYQLYWYELNRILENAKSYISFLGEADVDGITGADKILSVFEFRVPYYVGPLKEKSNPKFNHWMVRKAEGRIYPWNFNDMVDLDKSEDAFIARMTNSCTYLPGEDVLPKNSLVYCAFEVLNEINNIKINGDEIPVEAKQAIYENVFMQYDKVTPKRIFEYLVSNGWISGDAVMSGLDTTVKSSLKPFRIFRNLIKNGLLSYKDVESIIERATYSEDKSRYIKWLQKEYSNLPESEIKYISGCKFKTFGRLSRKFLCGMEGCDREIGETFTIIRAMWETNNNLMQLLSNKFTYVDGVRDFSKEYYDLHKRTISERLDEMYISNSVKRPIIRTLDILKDIVKVKGCAPKMFFVEMARGTNEDEKGKRKNSRLEQIRDLYKKVDTEDVRELNRILDEWGDTAHNKLQSDKLFLYFIQLGKCLYTGKTIDIHSVISGDGKYNIEHIYPRSFVKDDSVINNKILVDSNVNGEKSDTYPIDSEIQKNMYGYWKHLNKLDLLSEEKFKRLIRTSKFTDDEKFEFINRQLVETRQSTKVLATLLKDLYPDTEIVYVKAGLVSDFRKHFDVLKSRSVNDLHHAKDAYLNIVAGSVWHHKFSSRYYSKESDNNVKTEIVFTRPVKCGGKVIWNGAVDKDRVVKIARKNTAHITMYSYCKHSGQNGGFFDQNPLRKKEGLIPLKKDRPTEIYGGYDSATVSGFILVRYKIGKKTEVSFIPVKLLYLNELINNDDFAVEYVSKELGNKAKDIEILLNKRIIKIATMISLDGARFGIRGKAGLSDIGLMNMMPFITSYDYELYIKKLESFEVKHKKNENIVWDEKYDGISKEKNENLYTHYVEKLSAWPYNKRPGNTIYVEKLSKHIEDFKELDITKQIYVLIQIQGIFGRVKQTDLRDLKESANSGIAKLSLNLSNWKKQYTDVRIIDQSTSGLFEKMSENLLELL